MGLDVRLPVGLLFAAIGLALIAYGFGSDPAIYAKSLGVNVNLWWGLVLLAFGIIMLFLAWRNPDAVKRRNRTKPVKGAPVAR